jgi:hypothetical protein
MTEPRSPYHAGLVIALPWMDYQHLAPNRANRTGGTFARREAARQARHLAHMLALSKRSDGGRMPANPKLHIEFYPPDGIHRDNDGLLSSVKPYLDGICEAFGIDDYTINPVTVDRRKPEKPGQVVMLFEEMTE